MINLRFSRLPKHRKFNYTPVYYDEQKEELDARVQQAKREIGALQLDENAAKDNIRKLYKSKQHSNRYTSSAQKGYLLKMALIIMILSAITYKLIQSDALTFILKGLTK